LPVQSTSIVFFGTDVFSIPSLQALIDAKYQIEAVVTKPDARVGRDREVSPPPVKVLANSHDITVLQPSSAKELLALISGLNSVHGVVVAYGRIISTAVLDHFTGGLVNVHPSLLPKYRGPAPIEAAILNGDSRTGICIMRLDAGMDTGPVYIREAVPLSGNETRPTLHDQLASRGAEVLADNLTDIITGALKPVSQSSFTDEQLSVTSLISKVDGIIDWIKPAAAIERHIRAHLGWPGSKTMIDGIDATITAAHTGDSLLLVGTGETGGQPGTPFKTTAGELAIITGHGELIVDRIKPAGKNEMTGQAFLAGHKL
jgi:methionyl-tRNA formyltransferase